MNHKISIIVFSKGRPMQLHAYLESLLKFSDAQEEQITILYCETEGIRYDKVMNAFPKISWVIEKKFENNLKEAVSGAGEYIMFGCDDVVFTHAFSLQKAQEYLQKHEQVFGFSMRLGANITPQPANLSTDDEIFEWGWKCTEQHYNYPWELDCTLYRKADIVKLIEEEENPIKNPNFFEAMVTPEQREKRIPRTHMACNKKQGCAIVITVNRVQDTHQNGFDDSMLTDIYSLDKQYNDEDNTLDIEKIAQMDNHVVHVGAEYFILRKNAKGYSQKRIYKRKVKEFGEKLTKIPKRVYRHFEGKKYLTGGYEHKLSILNTNETLELLEKEQFSFLRYGDGEIAIMQGKSIPFQEYNPELAQKLKEMLRDNEKEIRIGIPYYYMHPLDSLNDFTKKFARALPVQRKFLCRNCSRNITYIDTALTQVYQTYKEYDFENYYERMQNLLRDRDITVVCGEGVLERLEYRALDVCHSVNYIYAPSMNAYTKYDDILRQILSTDTKRLVCVVLGPTAKILVSDLAKAGYQAWDMGHYFKDYDAYLRKRPRTGEEIAKFYQPD